MKNWWLIPLSIVVVLAVVTVIWAAVDPFPTPPQIKDSCFDAVAGTSIVDNYTCIGENEINVQIHSYPGRYELAQIDFEFFDSDGISQKKGNVTEDFPDINGEKVYSFSRDSLGIGGVEIQVSIRSGNSLKQCENQGIVLLKDC